MDKERVERYTATLDGVSPIISVLASNPENARNQITEQLNRPDNPSRIWYYQKWLEAGKRTITKHNGDIYTVCFCCEGTGKLTLEQGITIDCVWCTDGLMSAEQEAAYTFFQNAWCKCGNPSGNASYYHEGHSHGWTCNDCGKLLQTG